MGCVGCRVGAADDSPLIGLPGPGDRAEGRGVSGDGASCSGGRVENGRQEELCLG